MLNNVFGTMLIATWINTALLGLEICELARYFARFPDDSFWTRAHVVCMFCVDMICMYGACGAAYSYLVSGWGDLEAMETLSVNFAIYDGAMAVGILLVHVFLIRRYLLLSKNRFISLLLCLPALSAFINGAIVTYLTGVVYRKASDRPYERPWVTAFFVSSAIADTVIAVAMTHQLQNLQSPVDRTTGLIRRLMRNTILSGIAPSLLAIASFLSFLFDPISNTILIFTFNITRAGTLTVLYNLNHRRRARAQLEVVVEVDETVLSDRHNNRSDPQTANMHSLRLGDVGASHEAIDSKNYSIRGV
ncbi:hypothetical protein BKA62DRAFT_784944 [Auriculariales sp. MPI-PUGE-AT-0066]|nr:hypothetical protein BKA62DRAFT_784944 [Auriculariales sp. MPI-PUGE-AT-0066]